MTTSEAAEKVVEVVSPYIGSTMARSAIEAHCQKLGIAGSSVRPEQVESLLGRLAVTGGPLLERILTVAYPVLDLVLLLPLALLLRIALRLRGSHAGDVWVLLLGGFVVLGIADIFFAYFQSLGEQHLDPFVHASFLPSYGLIAGGAHRQLQLLKA